MEPKDIRNIEIEFAGAWVNWTGQRSNFLDLLLHFCAIDFLLLILVLWQTNFLYWIQGMLENIKLLKEQGHKRVLRKNNGENQIFKYLLE